MSKIVVWERQPDGSLVWCTDERALARVYSDSGRWMVSWFGEKGTSKWERFSDNFGQSHRQWLNHPVWSARRADDFPTDRDACLACEKHWPPADRYNREWFQSLLGGFFRQVAKGRVYVRADSEGWYAVRQDGRVLGKAVHDMRFPNHLDAMAAVEQEMHTPVDADPFRDKSNDWCWIRVKRPTRAA